MTPRMAMRPGTADAPGLLARSVITVAASIAAMVLMVGALWAWQGAGDIVADWQLSRPSAEEWAIRSGAIAAAALAQVVIVGVVAGQIFPRRGGDQIIVASAAGVFVIAVLLAMVLGVAGR